MYTGNPYTSTTISADTEGTEIIGGYKGGGAGDPDPPEKLQVAILF